MRGVVHYSSEAHKGMDRVDVLSSRNCYMDGIIRTVDNMPYGPRNIADLEETELLVDVAGGILIESLVPRLHLDEFTVIRTDQWGQKQCGEQLSRSTTWRSTSPIQVPGAYGRHHRYGLPRRPAWCQ